MTDDKARDDEGKYPGERVEYADLMDAVDTRDPGELVHLIKMDAMPRGVVYQVENTDGARLPRYLMHPASVSTAVRALEGAGFRSRMMAGDFQRADFQVWEDAHSFAREKGELIPGFTRQVMDGLAEKFD